MRFLAYLALCPGLIAGGSAAATEAKIGSWILDCPAAKAAGAGGAEPCLLRFEKRLLDRAGVTGELDVLAQGKVLVPALVLRGLSADILTAAAAAGTIEASLRFSGGAWAVLDCSTTEAGYVCSPREDAAQALGARLAAARSVTLRVTFAVAGLKPLMHEKTLDLSGTQEALGRLRMVGAAQVPGTAAATQVPSAGRLMEMADKALKAAGYVNGVADLVDKIRRKHPSD